MIADQAARLSALRAYEILDTPAEADFDVLAQIASDVCQTPVAAINFVDDERLWFKAEIGLGMREARLTPPFSGLALLQAGLMIVPDTLTDARFVFIRNPRGHWSRRYKKSGQVTERRCTHQ